MKLTQTIGLFLVVFLVSCQTKINSETYSNYQEKGNQISNVAQATLLVNVGKAIQEGGPEYAVEFCNLKASSIIDSLNRANNCNISRVSEKNRNPGNMLKTPSEKELWKIFQTSNKQDTLLQNNKKLVYYKRINMALPACLKCHGSTESDINPATKTKLQDLYPNDLATGYQLNDFRGLWKIEFRQE